MIITDASSEIEIDMPRDISRDVIEEPSPDLINENVLMYEDGTIQKTGKNINAALDLYRDGKKPAPTFIISPRKPGNPSHGNENNEPISLTSGKAFNRAGFNLGGIKNYYTTKPLIAYPVTALIIGSIGYSIIKATK